MSNIRIENELEHPHKRMESEGITGADNELPQKPKLMDPSYDGRQRKVTHEKI